jgi:hypothetical protein
MPHISSTLRGDYHLGRLLRWSTPVLSFGPRPNDTRPSLSSLSFDTRMGFEAAASPPPRRHGLYYKPDWVSPSTSSPLKLRALRARYVRLHGATFPEAKPLYDHATRLQVF